MKKEDRKELDEYFIRKIWVDTYVKYGKDKQAVKKADKAVDDYIVSWTKQ